MINLLEIEDKNVKSMMNDPNILRILPCLVQPKREVDSIKKGGENCAKCSFKKKKIYDAAMQRAKRCILTTRGQALVELKKALGTKQLRMIARNSAGRRVKYTF